MNETDMKIRSAFVSLLAEKPIEKISTREIAAEAGINRGTFYDHYMDKYDLYAQIRDDFCRDVYGMVTELVSMLMDGDENELKKAFGEYFSNNRDMIQVFLVKRADAELIETMKAAGKSAACRQAGVDEKDFTTEQMYAMEYIAGGQLALATMWFSRNLDVELPDFISLIRELNMRGAFTYLFGTM